MRLLRWLACLVFDHPYESLVYGDLCPRCGADIEDVLA